LRRNKRSVPIGNIRSVGASGTPRVETNGEVRADFGMAGICDDGCGVDLQQRVGDGVGGVVKRTVVGVEAGISESDGDGTASGRAGEGGDNRRSVGAEFGDVGGESVGGVHRPDVDVGDKGERGNL